MSAIEIVGTVAQVGTAAAEASKLATATSAVAKYAQTGANIAKAHPVAAAAVGAVAVGAAIYGSYKMFKAFSNRKGAKAEVVVEAVKPAKAAAAK